jgi:hypothetical protein
MFGRFFRSAPKGDPACNLRIGATPDCTTRVDDPQGLGGYKLAIDRLLREEKPDIIYLRSDNPADLSVVRKVLEYLSIMGTEIGVADQLPDTEVAAIFGVTVEDYLAAVDEAKEI